MTGAAFFDLDKTILAKSARWPSQSLCTKGSHRSVRRAQERVRAVRLPDVRRGSRPDGADAGLHAGAVCRLVGGTGAPDRGGHPGRGGRPDRLHRGHGTDRRASGSRPGRHRDFQLRYRDRRADMRSARCRPCRRHPNGHRRRRSLHPATSCSTPTARTRRLPCALAEESGWRPLRVLCLHRLVYRPADARSGGSPGCSKSGR